MRDKTIIIGCGDNSEDLETLKESLEKEMTIGKIQQNYLLWK